MKLQLNKLRIYETRKNPRPVNSLVNYINSPENVIPYHQSLAQVLCLKIAGYASIVSNKGGKVLWGNLPALMDYIQLIHSVSLYQ